MYSEGKVPSHVLCEMELGYGLALSPDDIVYSNPEFESVLGVLGSNE